jgi:WD40 repeat protein
VCCCQGHEDGLNSASLSPDERLLATASYDGTARVWDMATGASVQVLQHPCELQRVAWSPDGTRLVCWGDGPTAWLWALHQEAPLAALSEHKADIAAAAFSPGGAWLATCSADSSVLLWCGRSGVLRGLFVGDAALVDCCWVERQDGLTLMVGDASGQVHFLPCT